MHDPRPDFADSRVRGTGDELRNAYAGFYAYWGTFSVDAQRGTVEHKIQGSLWPEEVGSTRTRSASIEGSILTLTTPLYNADTVFASQVLRKAQIRDDEQLSNRLMWQRIN